MNLIDLPRTASRSPWSIPSVYSCKTLLMLHRLELTAVPDGISKSFPSSLGVPLVVSISTGLGSILLEMDFRGAENVLIWLELGPVRWMITLERLKDLSSLNHSRQSDWFPISFHAVVIAPLHYQKVM